MPVMNVDQATGLCGGVVVFNCSKLPWRRRPSRWGSALQCRWTNCGSMPSTPSTMTRGMLFCDPETPQPTRNASSRDGRAQARMYGGSGKVEDRFPFHPIRRLNPEQLECRGRHVLNAGILCLHLTI